MPTCESGDLPDQKEALGGPGSREMKDQMMRGSKNLHKTVEARARHAASIKIDDMKYSEVGGKVANCKPMHDCETQFIRRHTGACGKTVNFYLCTHSSADTGY